jgi:hypothetical protein
MNPRSCAAQPPHRCRCWSQAGEAPACSAAADQAVEYISARPKHVVGTSSWAARAFETTRLIRRERAAHLTVETGAGLKSP